MRWRSCGELDLVAGRHVSWLKRGTPVLSYYRSHVTDLIGKFVSCVAVENSYRNITLRLKSPFPPQSYIDDYLGNSSQTDMATQETSRRTTYVPSNSLPLILLDSCYLE